MPGAIRHPSSTRPFNRLHPMRFGAQVLPDTQGTRFRLWAPTARTVELLVHDQTVQMQAVGDGWFERIQPAAGHGTLYQYRINGELAVPDPASRFQPQDVHGPSQVIDPAHFDWQDADWHGRPWEEVILYELHVGTFTPQGTYRAVIDKLDYLVDLGITAIELMPLSEFPGHRNWGYDGVLHFAPESAYGSPDDLKTLIQAAHNKGLMVFLDVVYNHFGPEGNYLHAYAEPFFTERYHTPWGAAIQFEGPEPVREFFIENALYWLSEYHFDGLRLDAVHAIIDQSKLHFLTELVETVRSRIGPDRHRHIHLVLENDDNASRYLSGPPRQDHQLERLFNAQWNDDFHHAMHVLLTGEQEGYYEDYAEQTSNHSAVSHLVRCLTEGFAYQGEPSPFRDQAVRGETSTHLPPTAFVNFLQNHDQIGNRAFGDRLGTLFDRPEPLRAALAVFLLAPSIPLLFMGQEWESKKPFQFFCDFGPDLAPLVTEGRRKEFAKFPAFSQPENQGRIPDPSSAQTFENSKLDWVEANMPEHQVWHQFYKNLLTLRRDEIIPLLRPDSTGHANRPHARYHLEGTSGILAQWPVSEGRILLLATNLGDEPVRFHQSEFIDLTPLENHLIYQSDDIVTKELASGQLPAWSVAWLLK